MKPLTVDAETLLYDIREIPGYRNVSFKTRNREGNEELVMKVPRENIIAKIAYVSSPL